MEIYAESQIVEVPSYMHVGYLATKTIYPNDTVSTIGGFLFFIGVITSVAMIKVTKETKHKMTVMRLRKPLLIPILGIAFIILGIGAFSASYSLFGKYFWAHPEIMSGDRMNSITFDLNSLNFLPLGKEIHENPPQNLDEAIKLLKNSKYFSGRSYTTVDVWETSFKLDSLDYKGNKIYYCICAGEDKKFHTEDDYSDYEELNTDNQYLADYVDSIRTHALSVDEYYNLNNKDKETNEDNS